MDQSALGRDTELLQRTPVLAACRDGPVGRSTIAERADCSRTTAYRATTDLEQRGLLEQGDGGYRLTGLGVTALDRIERFRAELDGARHLESVLEHIDAPELRANVHLFADATVAVASPQNPNAPIEPWLEHFESFDRCRTLVVAGCPRAVTRQGVEHARNGVDFESICTPLALEADQNASEEAFETIATAESPSLYTNPDLPFTMGIIDEWVIIGGFDDETALPTVSVTTDDPDAREWADELYRRCRAEAVPLDGTSGPPTGPKREQRKGQ